MQTVASMREYINEYVRSQNIEKVGNELLNKYFGIPFNHDNKEEYYINNIPMSENDVRKYIKEFFQELDTPAVLDLYHRIIT
jgi:hypothetical protein